MHTWPPTRTPYSRCGPDTVRRASAITARACSVRAASSLLKAKAALMTQETSFSSGAPLGVLGLAAATSKVTTESGRMPGAQN